MGWFSHTDTEHMSIVLSLLNLEKSLMKRLVELEENIKEDDDKLYYWISRINRLEKELIWLKKKEPFNANRMAFNLNLINEAMENISRLEKNLNDEHKEIKEILKEALNLNNKEHTNEVDAVQKAEKKVKKVKDGVQEDNKPRFTLKADGSRHLRI
jgi:chromosome segregation ATPase